MFFKLGPIGVILIISLYIVLVLYSLYLVYTEKDTPGKVLWTIIILFIPFLGSIFYLLFFRGKKEGVSH